MPDSLGPLIGKGAVSVSYPKHVSQVKSSHRKTRWEYKLRGKQRFASARSCLSIERVNMQGYTETTSEPLHVDLTVHVCRMMMDPSWHQPPNMLPHGSLQCGPATTSISFDSSSHLFTVLYLNLSRASLWCLLLGSFQKSGAFISTPTIGPLL